MSFEEWDKEINADIGFAQWDESLQIPQPRPMTPIEVIDLVTRLPTQQENQNFSSLKYKTAVELGVPISALEDQLDNLNVNPQAMIQKARDLYSQVKREIDVKEVGNLLKYGFSPYGITDTDKYIGWMLDQNKGNQLPPELRTEYTQRTGNVIDDTGQIRRQTKGERLLAGLRGAGYQIAKTGAGLGAATMALTNKLGEMDDQMRAKGLLGVGVSPEQARQNLATGQWQQNIFDEARTKLQIWRAKNPQWFARKSTGGPIDYLHDPFQVVVDALESSGYMGTMAGASLVGAGIPTAIGLGVGQIYGVARDAGADPLQASIYAIIGGPIYGGIELIQWGQIAGLTESIKARTGNAIAKSVFSRIVKTAGIITEEQLFLGITEGLEEGLQGIMEQGVITLVNGEKITPTEFLDRFGRDYVQGGVVAILLGNVGLGAKLIAKGKMAITSKQQAEFQKELNTIDALIKQGIDPANAVGYVLRTTEELREAYFPIFTDTGERLALLFAPVQQENLPWLKGAQREPARTMLDNLKQGQTFTYEQQGYIKGFDKKTGEWGGMDSKGNFRRIDMDELVLPTPEYPVAPIAPEEKAAITGLGKPLQAAREIAKEKGTASEVSSEIAQPTPTELKPLQTEMPSAAKPITAKKSKRIISSEAFEAAKKRLTEPPPASLNEPGFRKGAAIDPQHFIDLITIGAYHFESGVRTFAEWSKKMLAEVGEKARPHLLTVWEELQNMAKMTGETKERGFITSVKEKYPSLRVEGQYVPRSTDELSIKARNLIVTNLGLAEQMAKTADSDAAVAVLAEIIKHYGNLANEAIIPIIKDAYNQKAAELVNTSAANLTELGRAIQAASLLARLTPEGQLRFAAAEIQKYNAELQKQQAGGTGRLGKVTSIFKKPIPELTAEQTNYIRTEMQAIQTMPETWEKARRFQALQNYISDLVPTPLMDKILFVWKAGLLTGIKTSGLNIFANTAFLGTELVTHNLFAVPLDIGVDLITGKRFVALQGPGAGKGIWEGLKKSWRFLRTGYDERNVATKYDWRHVNLGKNPVLKGLQAYGEFIFRMMGAEDQPFYYGARMMSALEQAKVGGINQGLKGKALAEFVDNFMAGATDNIMVQAAAEAESTVFQNRTALGQVAAHIQKLKPAQFIIPFGRTPSAVIMKALDYTPVGPIATVIENIGKGRFNQREFVKGIARGVPGTAIFLVGMALLEKNLMTLDWPTDEKERAQWDLEGKRANSIKVGKKYRTIQALGPIGMVLLFGGHFAYQFAQKQTFGEAVSKSFRGAILSFTQQTFLTGLNQFFNWLRGQGESFPKSFVSSWIPTLVGDIARATDAYERRADTTMQRVQAKVPYLRRLLEPQINVLGQKIERIGNPLEVMADPTRVSPDKQTPVIAELRRLFDVGYPVTPTLLGEKKGYKALTPQENTMLWERTGQAINDLLTAEFNDPDYQRFPDDLKAQRIKEDISYVQEEAKFQAWMAKIQGLSGLSLAEELIKLQESGLLSLSELINLSKPGGIITPQDLKNLERTGMIDEKKLIELGITKDKPKSSSIP